MQRRVISFDMGTRSMAVAHVEADTTLLRWQIVDLGTNQASLAVPKLLAAIDAPDGELHWMVECPADAIVVELQPREGVHKTLSHCLQTYSLLKTPQRAFHFMPANTKLKYDPVLYETMPRKTADQRKAITMTLTERLCTNVDCMLTYKDHLLKQRTDLADAFVQGCKYLQEDAVPKKKRKIFAA
jgi:hypothetical protein